MRWRGLPDDREGNKHWVAQKPLAELLKRTSILRGHRAACFRLKCTSGPFYAMPFIQGQTIYASGMVIHGLVATSWSTCV
jgi:hypothetical protein